jgi:hypothetical protein
MCVILIFHSRTVHLDTIKFFLFYPTDAQLNIVFTLRFALKVLLHVSA